MDFAPRRSQSSSILTYNLVRSGWLLLRALSGSPLGPARQVVARGDLTGELPKRGTPPPREKTLPACPAPTPHAGERELLSRLPECFARFRKLDKPDRDRVSRLLFTITEGMIWDLNTFPGEDRSEERRGGK